MADLRRHLGRLLNRRGGEPAAEPPPPVTSDVPTGWQRVRVAGAELLGRPVVAAHWSDLSDANLRWTVDALLAGGVPHWLLDSPRNGPHQLVIDAGDATAALEALRQAAGQTPVYLAEPPATGRRRTAPSPVGEAAPAGPLWRLFTVALTPAGGFLAGEDAACELQLWTESTSDTEPLGNHEVFDAGSLLAPGFTNRWTHVVPAAERQLVEVEVAGRALTKPAVLPTADVFTTTMPIDAVYTWVDGADDAWRQRRAAAGAAAGHALAVNASRFESHDELRYSLRSLEFYADWINHIWLVTDGQTPGWLDTGHDRITVIDHREIFTDPSVLPVFNSHAIESQLHHIDGLSEYFIYLNDDVFFTSPAQPEQYVLANGILLFQPSRLTIGLGVPRDEDTPVVAAAKRNAELLDQLAGVHVGNRMQHVPHALSRSVLAELEDRAPEAFGRTAAARLRSATDVAIPSSLAHYYGFVTRRAVPGKLRARYADLANPDAAGKLSSLLAQRNFDVLCLNDTDSESMPAEQRHQLVTDFLDAYFPYPSSFERTP